MTTLPTLHLNGTDTQTLAIQAQEAAESIITSISAAALAAPNARDYYTQGDDAYGKARAEFTAHLAALSAAREFFVTHALHAQDAIDAAAAARLSKRGVLPRGASHA